MSSSISIGLMKPVASAWRQMSMTSLKPQDLSKFLQSRVSILIVRHLPLCLSRLYLALLGWFYFLIVRKEKQASLAALAHSLSGRGRVGRKNFRRSWSRVRKGIFDHYHEKLLLGFRPLDWVRRMHLSNVQIKNLECLTEALETKQGVILVTGHYGAVEFIPGALAFRGYPVTVMVHCKSKVLRDSLELKAMKAGARLLDPKSERVLFSAVEHLRQGRIIVTQCDEIDMWRPHRDRRTRFLGLDMGLDRSLDILARKSGAVVLFGLNHRRGNGRYELVLERPEEHPAARGQSLVSARCLAVLNDNIYSEPGAWYQWKKLKPFVDKNSAGEGNEDRERISLPGQVAFSPSNPT